MRQFIIHLLNMNAAQPFYSDFEVQSAYVVRHYINSAKFTDIRLLVYICPKIQPRCAQFECFIQKRTL